MWAKLDMRILQRLALKSGYHHVDICLDHQKYLGFAWPFSGVVRYFSFTVLPFGLSSACFCFTKLMRPLVRRWRSMGHNSFIYLDDGFGSRPDKCSAVAASLIQRKELSSSGLLCNEEKSHWDPVQIGDWLSFVIDTILMCFRIPEKKVLKLKGLLDSAIQDGFSSFRELARIAGTIISAALAVGPISRLLTRQMYFAIETRSAWDYIIHFPPSLLQELKFWYCNIDCLNGYSIRPPLATHTVLFSDASDIAFGGFSATLDGSVVSGMWESEDIGQSSTFRELKAIFYVLLSYVAQLKHKRVKIFTDNQAAARIVAIGSSKSHLQALAMDIFNLCLANSIRFSKPSGSLGLLMKEQIFLADLLIKTTGPSIPRYFDLSMLNGALTELIAFRPITMPSFRGSTLNLLSQVAAVWTPWLRIGDMRITGFALRWVPLCLQLGLSRPAPVTAL